MSYYGSLVPGIHGIVAGQSRLVGKGHAKPHAPALYSSDGGPPMAPVDYCKSLE
jgi:hypothetical protein